MTDSRRVAIAMKALYEAFSALEGARDEALWQMAQHFVSYHDTLSLWHASHSEHVQDEDGGSQDE